MSAGSVDAGREEGTQMSWFWLDVPLAAALFTAWVAAGMWLVRACGRNSD